MSFKPRLTRPEAGNKYYITKAAGGWSPCICGSPKDRDCNVLSNCVGYAVGRFNEIAGRGKCDLLASTNAENMLDMRGKCSYGMKPQVGACICWAKGKTWDGSDGAGHVAIVEKVISDSEVVTSESAYGGAAFYTKTRKKGADGNWGMSSAYRFRGFIYQPTPVTASTPAPAPAPETAAPLKVGDVVKVRKGAKTYNGGGLASFVYELTYEVMEIGKAKPDRIVIGQNGVVTAAVKAEDLQKI